MEKPSRWERLDTPTKVIGGIVAAVVGVITVFLAIAGNPFAPSAEDQAAAKNPAAVAAHQVQRCLQAHGMRSPRVTVGEPAHHLRFRRCDWPPLTDTSTDGYSEINDFVTEIPGKAGVDLYDSVDRFTLPCDTAQVTYVLAQTGAREFVSRSVASGRLYLVTDVEKGNVMPRLIIKQLNFAPDDVSRYVAPPSNARELFILHTGHFQPFDAVCTHSQ
jgi:hypothetical protein